MGRRRSTNHDLPPRMHQKGGQFYYVTGTRPRKWIALGADINEARRKWAVLEGEAEDPRDRTFAVIARRYRREVMPTKALLTQRDNERELDKLEAVFGAVPIDAIRPADVREYMDIRGQQARTRANREKALLSHIFNHARAWGYTSAPNPCTGIRGYKEAGRDRYVTDDEYRAVWGAADADLRDAMDLALLTAQRPADVLKMNRDDIRDDALWVTQNKTGKKLRIAIVGELATVIERMQNRPRKVTGSALIQNEAGERLTYHAFRSRFDKARKAAGVDFQFRDLRAKAASDTGDLAHAQQLLGHKTRGMTEHYTRERIGDSVKPLNSGIVEDRAGIVEKRAPAKAPKPASILVGPLGLEPRTKGL
jgi:integrase